MISFPKLVEVANETIVFQGTNRHPSLEETEAHEKYLAEGAKHRREINESRERFVERVIETCKARASVKKPLTPQQMRDAARASGWAIGMESWPRFHEALTAALDFPPKRTKTNWLMIQEWHRNAILVARNLAGGQAEWRKRK